jgi:hypothetical protein
MRDKDTMRKIRMMKNFLRSKGIDNVDDRLAAKMLFGVNGAAHGNNINMNLKLRRKDRLLGGPL